MESVCGVLQWDQAAGWGQLVAAFVALGIALYVPWQQDRRRTANQVGMIFGLAEAAFEHIGTTTTSATIDRGTAEFAPTGLFSRTTKVLREIPAHAFEDARFVIPVLEFVDSLDAYASNLGSVEVEIHAFGSKSPDLDEALDASLNSIRRAMSELSKLSAEHTRAWWRIG